MSSAENFGHAAQLSRDVGAEGEVDHLPNALFREAFGLFPELIRRAREGVAAKLRRDVPAVAVR